MTLPPTINGMKGSKRLTWHPIKKPRPLKVETMFLLEKNPEIYSYSSELYYCNSPKNTIDFPTFVQKTGKKPAIDTKHK